MHRKILSVVWCHLARWVIVYGYIRTVQTVSMYVCTARYGTVLPSCPCVDSESRWATQMISPHAHPRGVPGKVYTMYIHSTYTYIRTYVHTLPTYIHIHTVRWMSLCRSMSLSDAPPALSMTGGPHGTAPEEEAIEAEGLIHVCADCMYIIVLV